MSAKLPKSSVRIRKDTPIAMATSVASFPVTPYHKEISSKSEKNEEQDEISIKRRTFDIFRRKVKTNLREKSTTQWNLPGLLKSTLPSMTKDVLVDNDADLQGLCVFFPKLLWHLYLNLINHCMGTLNYIKHNSNLFQSIKAMQLLTFYLYLSTRLSIENN
jgi:hypothetical protein